jgi:putative transcriptional regulator
MHTLQGQLLVASPELEDPNFVKSVLLMVDHNEEGAMGLTINRPLEMTVREAWEQVADDECWREDPLYHGGPCEGPLMAVHGREDLSQMRIMAGVYLSSEPDAVRSLLSDETAMKFVVGYAGWGPGQLESEVQQGAWLSTPATAEQIFHGDADAEQWSKLVEQLKPRIAPAGLDPRFVPDDPTVN